MGQSIQYAASCIIVCIHCITQNLSFSTLHFPVTRFAATADTRFGAIKITNPTQNNTQNNPTILRQSLSPINNRTELNGFKILNSARPSGGGKKGFRFGASRPNPAGNRFATLSGSNSTDNRICPPFLPFLFISSQNILFSCFINTHRLSLLSFSGCLS